MIQHEVQQMAQIFDQRPIDVDVQDPAYVEAGHRFVALYKEHQDELRAAIETLEGSKFRAMLSRLFELDKDATRKQRSARPDIIVTKN